MIVKMKKVSLVVLDSQKKESLKALRKLGVVHLEQVEGSGAVLSAFKESSARTDKALSILDEVKADKKLKIQQVKLTGEEASLKAKEILDLVDRKKSLFDSINQDTQELSRLEQWGAVDPSELASLAEKGIFAYMYEIPSEKYALIGDDLETMVVNSRLKTTRFLLLSKEPVETRPASLPAEAFSVPLPRESTDVLADSIRKAHQEIAAIDREILASKKYESALKEYRKQLASDIEFENIYSGMEHEAYEENDEGIKLAWLTGYVPVDSFERFKTGCRENSWAFASSDPADEDPVPTKLKNNKLVSLIYPLTDFLDVTPGYREYDISSWFLLFFCIFFAMIFGDAGYGALITIAGLGLMLKGLFKGKAGASVNFLIVLLGLTTFGWGVLTCSWFGIDGKMLPRELIELSYEKVSKFKYALVNGLPLDSKAAEDYANLNQKLFCFVLAFIQLSVAHLKGIVANRKSLKAFGEFGALLELWGMFYVVLAMVGDPERFHLGLDETSIMVGGLPLSYICIGVLFFGFLLNFVFSNYSGSIKDSVLESVKNIISVLLGIVNVFSDMVSYIRLWAVALAGAAISGTVNAMAGPMFGKLTMVVFGVLLLVFGHGLNLILNLLSVIVHGVRLNTLEFSQHLGMSWSGIKYRPFSEQEQ
ncbi:MAG: ATPase [Treponema sp.]|nr:ATPase [Treponema sp.]